MWVSSDDAPKKKKRSRSRSRGKKDGPQFIEFRDVDGKLWRRSTRHLQMGRTTDGLEVPIFIHDDRDKYSSDEERSPSAGVMALPVGPDDDALAPTESENTGGATASTDAHEDDEEDVDDPRQEIDEVDSSPAEPVIVKMVIKPLAKRVLVPSLLSTANPGPPPYPPPPCAKKTPAFFPPPPGPPPPPTHSPQPPKFVPPPPKVRGPMLPTFQNPAGGGCPSGGGGLSTYVFHGGNFQDMARPMPPPPVWMGPPNDHPVGFAGPALQLLAPMPPPPGGMQYLGGMAAVAPVVGMKSVPSHLIAEALARLHYP